MSQAITKELFGYKVKAKGSDTEVGGEISAKDPDADTVSCASDGSPVLEAGSSLALEGEMVPKDVEQWQVLVQQLDDLVCIECLLKLQPSEYRKETAGDEINVSVALLLDGGKGGYCFSV